MFLESWRIGSLGGLAIIIHLNNIIQLDGNVDLIEYGLVVSADAAAQMICAPLFGLLIDKFSAPFLYYFGIIIYILRIQTVRPIALLCCTLFCGGNIFYALVGVFDRNHLFGNYYPNFKVRVWMMLLSRFVVGAGTGTISTLKISQFGLKSQV